MVWILKSMPRCVAFWTSRAFRSFSRCNNTIVITLIIIIIILISFLLSFLLVFIYSICSIVNRLHKTVIKYYENKLNSKLKFVKYNKCLNKFLNVTHNRWRKEENVWFIQTKLSIISERKREREKKKVMKKVREISERKGETTKPTQNVKRNKKNNV